MPRKLSSAEKFRRSLALDEFAAALRRPCPRTVTSPKVTDNELLACYVMGDPHFGMYSWKDETGADFDLKIAERDTKGAVDNLVSRAPRASSAVLIVLGDLIHSDTKQNRTEASGHPLDVDTWWSRVMGVALRTLVYSVRRLLQVHRRVTVRLCEGNHDPQAAFSIALALSEHFRNERRVKLDLSPAAIWYHQWGTNLIMATHGHRIKLKQLIPVMAADRPKEWAKTTCRLAYVGHGHHEEIHAVPGGRAKMCPVLPPSDAYAAGGPWRADRSMFVDILHTKYGRIGEIICPIGMIS